MAQSAILILRRFKYRFLQVLYEINEIQVLYKINEIQVLYKIHEIYAVTDTDSTKVFLNDAQTSFEIATPSSKHTYPNPIDSLVLGFLHTLAQINPDCNLEKWPNRSSSPNSVGMFSTNRVVPPTSNL